MKKIFLASVLSAGLISLPAMAAYPEKDVQGIIQWAAGGSTDTVMRAVTPHAEDVLGEDIVLTNRSGGVGAIATKFSLAKPADGYTLLMGAENPQLYKVMGLGDFDYSDFTPINVIARGVPILVANNDAPYNSLQELAEYAQANPGKVKIGSTGPGGLPSVITAMLSSQIELPLTVVPYDGDGPALTAIQGGAIDVMPSVLSAALENIKAGRMKVLTLLDTTENPQLPGVEPITTAYPAFDAYLPWGPFFGIFVKNGTPDDAVAKLTEAFSASVEQPEFTQMMEGRAFQIMNLTGTEAEDFLTQWQSTTSWLVFDAGAAKKSPEEFGIPKPGS